MVDRGPYVPPPELPRGLGPVTPVLSRRGVFIPEVGKHLNVMLPGEIVRCEVTEVLSANAAVVTITSICIDKSGHGYKKDSVLAVQRSWDGMSEQWGPISDREIREREAIDRAREQIAAEEEARRELAASMDAGLDESLRQT